MSKSTFVSGFIETLKKHHPHEPEFHQAVLEWAEAVIPFVEQNEQYQKRNLLERMVEPDRIVSFRVSWLDDNGNTRVNRGHRVQFNQAKGPYKGGIRFHPSVNLSILKFLGFEQVFKNSLTALPLGGGKGGADFNPKGKSDDEIMRFCQAFMLNLFSHIGPETDVPAGDIGVGSREVGYMFGMYKKLKNEHTGALTGKGLSFGGSPLRTEATGYGLVYFTREMLKAKFEDLAGKKCVISGAGNVALHTAEKLLEMDAKVLSLSDSSGMVHMPQGLGREQLKFVKILKTEKGGSLQEFAKEFDLKHFTRKKPWDIACDIAFPCATQNELDESHAKVLINNGCQAVAEGANMPTTAAGIELFRASNILFAPGKASNAGGVATSGFEMAQNAQDMGWNRERVDKHLQKTMREIHQQCVDFGKSGDDIDYVKGANVAGFVGVADAMLAQGVT